MSLLIKYETIVIHETTYLSHQNSSNSLPHTKTEFTITPPLQWDNDYNPPESCKPLIKRLTQEKYKITNTQIVNLGSVPVSGYGTHTAYLNVYTLELQPTCGCF